MTARAVGLMYKHVDILTTVILLEAEVPAVQGVEGLVEHLEELRVEFGVDTERVKDKKSGRMVKRLVGSVVEKLVGGDEKTSFNEWR